uniref:Reverse transcriptase domain-containing protein n=1 Tax=Angiostrongylus cantonensis TaxID=6313 RepID=A0A0K0D387_ANGCA
MGQRLAPVLATVFMFMLEAPVTDLRPSLCCRYTDDCALSFPQHKKVDKCLEFLNEQSEYIMFSQEKPKETCSSFLNAQTNLCDGGYITGLLALL